MPKLSPAVLALYRRFHTMVRIRDRAEAHRLQAEEHWRKRAPTKALSLDLSKLVLVERAVLATREALTETARREVHQYLINELADDRAGECWYELALAPHDADIGRDESMELDAIGYSDLLAQVERYREALEKIAQWRNSPDHLLRGASANVPLTMVAGIAAAALADSEVSE